MKSKMPKMPMTTHMDDKMLKGMPKMPHKQKK